MFGETLLRIEVSTSHKTLFNHKAGSTPQDTIVSIITLVIILCFESIRCLLLFHSQQSPNLLLGGGSSGRWKVSNDSVEYFTCSDTDESKLEFNSIGKELLRLPWKNHWIISLVCCHSHGTYLAGQSSGRQVVLNCRCEGHLAVIFFSMRKPAYCEL